MWHKSSFGQNIVGERHGFNIPDWQTVQFISAVISENFINDCKCIEIKRNHSRLICIQVINNTNFILTISSAVNGKRFKTELDSERNKQF